MANNVYMDRRAKDFRSWHIHSNRARNQTSQINWLKEQVLIQWAATFKTVQTETWRTTEVWQMPPMSHGAFLPTALFMFQTLNKQVDHFSEDNVGALALTAVKTRIWAPQPHLLLFTEASPKRVDVECVGWLAGSFPQGIELEAALLDQLLCLEEAPQVEDLPCGQPNETAHGEYAEVQHACVGGLWRVSN